jgi:hypothetical protein
MIADITTVVTGILSSITNIIDPTTGSSSSSAAVAYAAVLALPILGGTVAFARRLIKKSR